MTSPADKIKERLDQWREIEEKATPANWFIDGSEVRYDHDPYCTDSGISDCTVQVCDIPMISEKLDHRAGDREFIAYSRNNSATHRKAIEKLVEGLRFYARGAHLWQESETHIANLGHPIGHPAQQVLTEVAEMLSGGER